MKKLLAAFGLTISLLLAPFSASAVAADSAASVPAVVMAGGQTPGQGQTQTSDNDDGGWGLWGLLGLLGLLGFLGMRKGKEHGSSPATGRGTPPR